MFLRLREAQVVRSTDRNPTDACSEFDLKCLDCEEELLLRVGRKAFPNVSVLVGSPAWVLAWSLLYVV